MLFVAAVICASLSAQFLVQTISSFITGIIYLSALIFSRVSKSLNAIFTLTSMGMAVLFLVLFLGGNWFASNYIDYGSWNVNSIASVVAFLMTLAYCSLQVPGKILVARMSAWQPNFAQVARARGYTPDETVTFAREFQKEHAQ